MLWNLQPISAESPWTSHGHLLASFVSVTNGQIQNGPIDSPEATFRTSNTLVWNLLNSFDAKWMICAFGVVHWQRIRCVTALNPRRLPPHWWLGLGREKKNNANRDTLSARWLHAPLDWAISVTNSVAVCNTINVCCKTKIDARSVPSPSGAHRERPHSAEKFTVYYRREAAEPLLRVAARQGVCTKMQSVNLKGRILVSCSETEGLKWNVSTEAMFPCTTCAQYN